MESKEWIVYPTKNGPKIAHILPRIEKIEKAPNWFVIGNFFTKTLLLHAWIGPIKKPIDNAINQKKITFSTIRSPEVRKSKATIHNKTAFSELKDFSKNPKIMQPTTPLKLINTPSSRISDSLKSYRKDANILAKAKTLTTPLLKKK